MQRKTGREGEGEGSECRVGGGGTWVYGSGGGRGNAAVPVYGDDGATAAAAAAACLTLTGRRRYGMTAVCTKTGNGDKNNDCVAIVTQQNDAVQKILRRDTLMIK